MPIAYSLDNSALLNTFYRQKKQIVCKYSLIHIMYKYINLQVIVVVIINQQSTPFKEGVLSGCSTCQK